MLAVSPIRASGPTRSRTAADGQVLLADVHPGDPRPGAAGGQEHVDPVVDEQRDRLGQHRGDLQHRVEELPRVGLLLPHLHRGHPAGHRGRDQVGQVVSGGRGLSDVSVTR